MEFESAKQDEVPSDLRQALASTPLAEAKWCELTPIGRRDFVTWIGEAKQAQTRQKRISRTCEDLIAGKRRPCCFAVVPMDFYKALGSDPAAKARWSTLTPIERRDITDWIQAAEGKHDRTARIQEGCAILASVR